MHSQMMNALRMLMSMLMSACQHGELCDSLLVFHRTIISCTDVGQLKLVRLYAVFLQ